jgi:hypothetical protein
MDDKLVEDLKRMIDEEQSHVDLLEKLYYHPDFGTFSTRPIISMVITGCKYIRDNLTVLRDKYLGTAKR